MKDTLFSVMAFLVVPGGALLGGCGKSTQESIDEVQYGLMTAAALGRTSALSMDAIAGTSMVCATVMTACTMYPCDGSVTIALGAGCPLPLGGEASGTVSVTGRWSSADQATLSQTFASTQVASSAKALAVASVTQVSARRSGSTIDVSYTGSNAVAGASGSAVAVGAGSSWDIAIDTRGTPDPADDRLTIDASSAAGGGFSARAVTIRDVVLDPGCRRNPTSGSADITEVSGLIPKILNIQFHAACDGKVDVDGEAHDFQILP